MHELCRAGPMVVKQDLDREGRTCKILEAEVKELRWEPQASTRGLTGVQSGKRRGPQCGVCAPATTKLPRDFEILLSQVRSCLTLMSASEKRFASACTAARAIRKLKGPPGLESSVCVRCRSAPPASAEGCSSAWKACQVLVKRNDVNTGKML